MGILVGKSLLVVVALGYPISWRYDFMNEHPAISYDDSIADLAHVIVTSAFVA